MVGDEAVHKQLGDSMERAAITASSLEAEQDSGVADAQTWFEAASKQSNDPPLSSINILGCGEDGMKLMELMAHCTKFSDLNQTIVANSTTKAEYVVAANYRGHYFILTASPTLYTSPIEQFWHTAALCTLEKEVMGITATIDKKVKILVSEASIRRRLKIEDAYGIPSLPDVEIFEQLALIGVHLLGSDEGRLKHDELMELVTKLSDRVVAVEEDLKQTKKGYSTAVTKL
ncbi:hypothetical protein Tco_1161170, partial [Tanacetum coccineum]